MIAFVLLWVFCKCRSRPSTADAYPMVHSNGKQGGYAPIPATPVTPAMATRSEHNPEQRLMNDETEEDASMPFIPTRMGQLNGYQPLKGAVIPNGNGTTGMKNGAKKKDFKEWYV